MTGTIQSDWPYADAILEALRQKFPHIPESLDQAAPLPIPSGTRAMDRDDADSPDAGETALDRVRSRIATRLGERFDPARLAETPRHELARQISELVGRELADTAIALDLTAQRQLVVGLLVEIMGENGRRAVDALPPDGKLPPNGKAGRANGTAAPVNGARADIEAAKGRVQPILLSRIDITTASKLPRTELALQIGDVVGEILGEERLQLNRREQRDLVTALLNDMLGLGPLEPLLADESVTDILVNGAGRIFVERGGKLELTPVTFRDDAHVMHVATRIVTRIGRRIDDSTPLVDARLEDGSRVNIITPPLAIDGPAISIRKFAKKSITLEIMGRQQNVSEPLAALLKVAARAKINILISGGTGSGKTTLLNALSQTIDPAERIVTIEDAAELQLQQPHVVRLETRPPNLEGQGEINQRLLVKNALHMRPDRIILGEVRGAEALDMLQAMNTGHDGSMCTVHANNPREALSRLENMVAMSGVTLPAAAVRSQIASAIQLIVQIARMRDDMRRIVHVANVVGMEGDVITTQDLFTYAYEGEGPDGRLSGQFKASGLRPHFTPPGGIFRAAQAASGRRGMPSLNPDMLLVLAVFAGALVGFGSLALAIGNAGARTRERTRRRLGQVAGTLPAGPLPTPPAIRLAAAAWSAAYGARANGIRSLTSCSPRGLSRSWSAAPGSWFSICPRRLRWWGAALPG